MAGKHDGRLKPDSFDDLIEHLASRLQPTDHDQMKSLPEARNASKRFNDPRDVFARLRASRGKNKIIEMKAATGLHRVQHTFVHDRVEVTACPIRHNSDPFPGDAV